MHTVTAYWWKLDGRLDSGRNGVLCKGLFVVRLLIALVIAAANVSAQSGREIATAYFKQLLDRRIATGGYFAEVAHGEVIETSAFGKALPDSLWRAASTSKALNCCGDHEACRGRTTGSGC